MKIWENHQIDSRNRMPGNWQLQGCGKMHYSDLWYNFPINPPYVPTENPTGIYKRTFSVEESFAGRQIILRFCGVDSAYHVWVNGTEIGYSKGARLEVEFDITDVVKIGGGNDITVRVYQWSDGTYLEDQDRLLRLNYWMQKEIRYLPRVLKQPEKKFLSGGVLNSRSIGQRKPLIYIIWS